MHTIFGIAAGSLRNNEILCYKETDKLKILYIRICIHKLNMDYKLRKKKEHMK